jgi:hypothetical protein
VPPLTEAILLPTPAVNGTLNIRFSGAMLARISRQVA